MARTLEYEIISKVRKLSRALTARNSAVLKSFGLTAVERAVLEVLFPDAVLTVPQIARRFRVSRQHVQVTANALIETGYIFQCSNPDHARSALLGLTEKGRAARTAIQDSEQEVMDGLFPGIPTAEKVVTSRVLGQLLKKT